MQVYLMLKTCANPEMHYKLINHYKHYKWHVQLRYLQEAMNFEFIVKAVDPIMLCGDSVDTQYVRIYM